MVIQKTKTDKELVYSSITDWLEVGYRVLEEEPFDTEKFYSWKSRCMVGLPMLFSKHVVEEFDTITTILGFIAMNEDLTPRRIECLKSGLALLADLLKDLWLHIDGADSSKSFVNKCLKAAQEFAERLTSAAAEGAVKGSMQ